MEAVTNITNLGFAAYLIMTGHKLIDTPYRDDKNQFIFKIDVDQSQIKDLFYQYSTSKFNKFDSIVVSLKRMLPPRR